MQKLIIYGAGKIAKIVFQYLKSKYDVSVFTVDRAFIKSESLYDRPIVPFEKISEDYSTEEYKMIIAIGYHNMNRVRENKFLEAKSKGYELISYVDDHVKRFDNVVIGENCIVLENTTVQPYSKIGNNSVIWSNAAISHGVKIGNNCWVASGAVVGGDTVIQSNCFIGINASIGHNVTIGSSNYIGASAQVCKNTTANDVYISEQAIKFRMNSDQFMKFAKI